MTLKAGATEGLREVDLTWEIMVPVRDGARLGCTLYLPAVLSEPHPAIMTITPYTRQIHHEQGVYFASRGYPFLVADVRGRGSSDGDYHPLADAGYDAHDLVEWVASQSFCNGKVAMWGGSYSGYLQWIAAKERPPHLAAIAPVASPYRGVDGPMINNVFNSYRIQWLTQLSGRTAQDKLFGDRTFWNGQFRRWFEAGLPFEALDRFVGNPSPIFQEWIRHPEPGEYWDDYNPTPAQYAQITIPVLTITGAYDSNQLGAMAHYRRHLDTAPEAASESHYLVIGPWDHGGTRSPKPEFCGLKAGPASLVDLLELHLQYYDWTLNNGPKPEFLRKRVAYYVLGAEQWRYADTLDDITDGDLPLYLTTAAQADDFGSRGLSLAPADKTVADRYRHDPRDVTLASLEAELDPEDRTDQRLFVASDGKQLTYDSAPFDRAFEIAGFPRLYVWISIDQPDTDFRASIQLVMPGGSTIELGSQIFRARYRKRLDRAELVSTRKPLRYEFADFPFAARRVEEGCRLRLAIGPNHSIHWQKNYNSGGTVSNESVKDARVVTVEVHHGADYPSALHIPLGREDETPVESARDGVAPELQP